MKYNLEQRIFQVKKLNEFKKITLTLQLVYRTELLGYS